MKVQRPFAKAGAKRAGDFRAREAPSAKGITDVNTKIKSLLFQFTGALTAGVIALTVEGQASDSSLLLPKIDRRPGADDLSRLHGKLTTLPVYDAEATNPFKNDLRSADLSKLDLRESGSKDLIHMSFDSRTVWPPVERMSKDFDPARVMELGKNPGLGIRSLHARGITGRGVAIAIVDQPLIIEHEEFGKRIQLYEETNIQPGTPSQMHGPAVASIAAGKSVGVAPEADIYYLAAFAFDTTGKDGKAMNFRWYAQAVRRIVEINQQLPPEKKIRVISLSIGWHESQTGADEMEKAVAAAKKAGMLVTSSSINETHGVQINGLGRAPLADPDKFESYAPGMFWAKHLNNPRLPKNALLMPMDSRCTAGPTGAKDYAFYRQGGWSWITPYLAGVYALTVQVKPEITPDEFLSLARKTGRAMNWPLDNTTLPLGVIIDPGALIDALKQK